MSQRQTLHPTTILVSPSPSSALSSPESKISYLPSGERAEKIKQQIDKKWKTLKKNPPYIYRGKNTEYYFRCYGVLVTSTQVIEMMCRERQDSLPIQVADPGTGAGYVPMYLNQHFEGRVNAKGYTGTDYGTRNKAIFTEDVEDFLKCSGIKPNSQDVIFGSHIVEHIIDPARMCMDAYLALKVGGIIIFNDFLFYGLEEQHQDFFDHLKQDGYEIIEFIGRSEGESLEIVRILIMRKTKDKPTLNLPLEYTNEFKKNDEGQVIYRSTLPPFKNDPKKIVELDEIRQKLEKIIFEKGKELTNADLKAFVATIDRAYIKIARSELKARELSMCEEIESNDNYHANHFLLKDLKLRCELAPSYYSDIPKDQFLNLILILAAAEHRLHENYEKLIKMGPEIRLAKELEAPLMEEFNLVLDGIVAQQNLNATVLKKIPSHSVLFPSEQKTESKAVVASKKISTKRGFPFCCFNKSS